MKPKRDSLRRRIETRTDRSRDRDFLPREFVDLGGEDQVLRARRELTRQGRVVRLGYGVYGRAVTSRLTGQPLVYGENGFWGGVREAPTKLGVACEPTAAERAYNEGRTTQVLVNPVVRLRRGAPARA